MTLFRAEGRVRFLVSLTVLVLALETSALARQASPFVPGQTYYGRNQYIEYIAGNSPYILSAPHGGDLTPAEIPDRTSGETVTDSNVMQFARTFSATVFAREGRYPHVIICRLKRTKLDANRDLAEALEGSNPYAIQAWKEFQSFIDTAAQAVVQNFGKGFYVDIHGHGHTIQRLELGYLLSSTSLNLSDNSLNNGSYGNSSSIRSMIAPSKLTFAQLLRGPQSLGTLLQNRNFPAVPSQQQPSPGFDPYFSGGYNTERHGSSNGGPISGVQIECNFTGVRDTPESRQRFADALSDALQVYTSSLLFVTAVETDKTMPAHFELLQNYPNPFNPSTTIPFSTPEESQVKIVVYDVLGRIVSTIIDQRLHAGRYGVSFDAGALPSGVYYFRLHAAGLSLTKKMVLVR